MIGDFFEGVGVLIREGLLDVRLVALLMTGQAKMFWERNQSFIEEMRRDWNAPRIWSEWEYLYNELMKYNEEHPELSP